MTQEAGRHSDNLGEACLRISGGMAPASILVQLPKNNGCLANPAVGCASRLCGGDVGPCDRVLAALAEIIPYEILSYFAAAAAAARWRMEARIFSGNPFCECRNLWMGK